jgi:hypothetical protein
MPTPDWANADMTERMGGVPGDLAVHTTLSDAAYARGRFRHAVVLARAAADAGEPQALRRLAEMRKEAGDRVYEEVPRFGLTADGQPEKPWTPA